MPVKLKTHDVIDQFPDSQAFKVRQWAKELSDRTVAQIIHEYNIDNDNWDLTLIMESGRSVKYPCSVRVFGRT